MATATLRPDGVVASSGAPTLVGASYNAAAADNSDTTYATFPDSGSYYAVEYSLATVALPAGAQVRSVTPRVRHNNNWSALTANRGFTLLAGGNAFSTDSIANNNGAYAVQVGTARAAQPDGTAWTQAAIDGLSLRVSDLIFDAYFPPFSVSEVYVDVVYNVAPTATGTALGSVATSRPTFTWAYSDTEGDPQERFRVKVFSAAQYSAGGFDPNTSTPTVDSGEIYSSATSWACTADLTNGTTYRAFIFVSDYGSAGRYNVVSASGPYASATIALTAPNAPTINASLDAANDRITLAISAVNNLNPATTYAFVVQRSDDGGTTWNTLTRLWYAPYMTTDYLHLDFWGTTAAPSLTLYDYESVRGGTTPQYRSYVAATKSGNALISANSATASPAAALPLSGWRIRSILSPVTMTPLYVGGDALEWQSKERQSVFYALGRANPVVLSDAVGGETADCELTFLSDVAYASFEALRKRMETMLLQSPYGDSRYVRFGPSRAAHHVLGLSVRKWTVKVSFIEVDP